MKNDENRAEKLLSAISNIDDEFIEEADTSKVVPMRKKNYKKWIGMAACFAVILMALVPILSNQFTKNDMTSNDAAEDSVEEYFDDSIEMKNYSKIVEESSDNETYVEACIETVTQGENLSVEVTFTNNSDEDYMVSPKFELYRVDDSGNMESVVIDESKVAFVEVIYELPANASCIVSYDIDSSVYDINEAGDYRIVLFYTGENDDGDMTTYCDFEIS